MLVKRSSIDFCVILLRSLLRCDLGILTGEPLTLTKTLVLLTDLFIGDFFPVEVAAGLTAGEFPGKFNPARFLARDDGVKTFLGREATGLDKGVAVCAFWGEEEDAEV